MRILITALMLVLASTSQAWAVSETCQAAWERAERIRVELGLRPGPKTAPEDPLRPEAACDALLATTEEDLRNAIRESIEICGGDCRDLVPENKRWELEE